MKPGVRDWLTISAPSRLHFGLFSIGNLTERMYGGMGMMIHSPRTRVHARTAPQLSYTDERSQSSLTSIVNRWFQSNLILMRSLNIHRVDELPIELCLGSTAPSHSGFGSGTQTSLATALLVTKMLKLPQPSAEELAASVDRGKRSAIGSHGFLQGGVLVDEGKTDQTPLAPLDLRVEFPEDWRIVTILSHSSRPVFGHHEREAFEQLPPTAVAEREFMTRLVKQVVIPALLEQDYPTFGEALYEFGRRSGQMFQNIQGGPYNGEQIAAIVQSARDLGCLATGQSSWGPCVYAILPSPTEADNLLRRLHLKFGKSVTIEISEGDNQGAFLSLASHQPSH